MSSSEQTYTKGFSDLLLHAVGGIKNAGIATLAMRLTAFIGEDGDACVSIDSLCELFNCSENTIKSYAKKLSLLGVWQLKTSAGKGHISIWSKGSNFDTYIGVQKYQTLMPKVSNFDTYNIDNNKESKSARVHASTLPTHPKKKYKKEHGDAPCNPQQFMTAEFENFWNEFHAAPEYECEKERCAAIFAQMGKLLREDIVKSLRAYNRRPTRFHLRARKNNPRYYLVDYVPTSLRLSKIGTEVTYQKYVDFYGTDLEMDGWKRIHIPAEQRTIFRKEA